MTELKVTDVRVLPGDSAFLLDDGETSILVDSGFGFTGFEVAKKIKALLGDRPLDYIFLTHSHYDHALGSAYVLEVYPDAKVVAGEYAAKIFQKPGARATMCDLDRKMAKSCGVDSYPNLIDNLRVDIPLQDGQTVQAGKMTFTAVHLPGHTKCSFGFYEPSHKLLLGCETLGSFNGESDVMPSYLVGYGLSADSIEKVKKLDIKGLLAAHYGVIEGETLALYMAKAEESCHAMAHSIVSMLKSGMDKGDIAEAIKARYYHGYIKTVYPIDAMNLNTGIMIDMIERECLSR